MINNSLQISLAFLMLWGGLYFNSHNSNINSTIAEPQRAAMMNLACNDTINISLDDNCQFYLSADHVTEGLDVGCSVRILVDDEDTSNGNIVDGCGVFKFLVTIDGPCPNLDGADNCWGYVNAEDKTAPIVTAPDDVSLLISCLNYDSILHNPLSVRHTGHALVTDNCLSETEPLYKFVDEVTHDDDCGTLTIRRRFSYKDKKDNTGSDEQIITLTRPALSALELKTTFELDAGCAQNAAFPLDKNGNIHPSVSGFPYFINSLKDTVFLTEEICGLTPLYKDARFDICDEAYKLVRTWTIKDWCTGEERVIEQTIKIGDIEPPVLSCAADTLYYSISPFDCTAALELPFPVVDEACSDYEVAIEVYGVPAEDLYRPGQQKEVLLLSRTFHAEPQLVSGLPAGCHRVVYTVRDACKNTTSIECVLCIKDDVQPVPECVDLIRVSLDNYGYGRVEAIELDEGSYDNCKLDQLLIRRKATGDCVNELSDFTITPDGYTDWATITPFFCCDLNKRTEVQLKAIDANGNENVCWGEVIVEDKIAPECQDLREVDLRCDDLPLGFIPGDTTLLQSLYGLPDPGNDCGAYIKELEPVVDLDECGVGKITRRFTITDGVGNQGKSICKQRISITPGHNYWIKFPKDYKEVCAEPSPDSIDLHEIGCDLLAVSLEEETFQGEAEECYKIHRTFRVINWCEYNGEDEPVRVSRDADCDGMPGDEDVYVIVRPDGTTYYDADTDEKNDNPLKDTYTDDCYGFRDNQGHWINSQDKPSITSVGFWEYMQVVKVYDNEPPVIYYDSTLTVCVDQLDCTAEVVISFAVIDNCVAEDVEITTFVEESVDEYYEFSENPWDIVGRYPKYVMVGLIPQGKYVIEIKADDRCGNVTRVEYELEVVDCKGPTPTCIRGLAAELSAVAPGVDADGDGDEDVAMATVWAEDFISEGLVFDCSGPISYSINRVGEPARKEQTALVVTCDDPDYLEVEIHAWDNAYNPTLVQPDGSLGGANHDYCVTTLLVQDNKYGLCKGDVSAAISGRIIRPNGVPIEEVEVKLSGSSQLNTMTDNEGHYTAPGLRAGNDYTLTPDKRGDAREGVSTYDLLLVAKHILGVEPLESPYALLAADVNNSGAISTLDMIQIRKLILSLETSFENGRSWRFVDARTNLDGLSLPQLIRTSEVININNLSQEAPDFDFLGIKLGDVSDMRTTTAGLRGQQVKQGQSLLRIDNSRVDIGETIKVPVYLSEVQGVSGFQFSLELSAAAENIELIPHQLRAEQFHVYGPFIYVSYLSAFQNDVLDEAEPLFYISLTGKKQGTVDTYITLAPTKLSAELYREGAVREELILAFSEVNDREASLQVYPNPTSGDIWVSVDLDTVVEELSIRLYNAQGQLIWRTQLGEGKQYTEKIESTLLKHSGVYFLQIESATHSWVRQIHRN